MINVMEEDTKDILMVTFTKGNSSMVKLMVRAGINGSQMVRSMMENGQRVSDMDMVFGNVLLRTQMGL
jgi:hypothetical protein